MIIFRQLVISLTFVLLNPGTSSFESSVDADEHVSEQASLLESTFSIGCW